MPEMEGGAYPAYPACRAWALLRDAPPTGSSVLVLLLLSSPTVSIIFAFSPRPLGVVGPPRALFVPPPCP